MSGHVTALKFIISQFFKLKKSVVRCLLSVDFSYLWRSLIFKKYEVKS